MKMNLTIKGIEKVRSELESLTGRQGRVAFAKALNDTAFEELVPAFKKQVALKFDRPTDYVLNAPRIVSRATADRLSVTVAPTYWSQLGTKGGKAGVDPQQILQAQEFGGPRRDKRSEVVLRRAGILPAGMQIAIPANPFPGSDDGHGNLKGNFLVQILAYFQAFGEQGYKANMKDRTRANLARGGTAAKLAKVAGPHLGRRYFVAYGKARGGARITARGEADSRASNLQPGIWAVLGSTGAVVRPVVMFVRKGSYTPRLDTQSIATSPAAQETLGRKMRFRIREAAGV